MADSHPSSDDKVAFECSYDDCFQSFDTEGEMRAHLKNKNIHPWYCGKTPGYDKLMSGFVKCDFHGKTCDELVAHKVETMLPWLVGERRFEKPKKLNHIVCEFCGMDFSSLSGREAHRKMMHQAEQHIVCRGYVMVQDGQGNSVREECGSVFGLASQLIFHIEGGFCAYIKPMSLKHDREHKHMVKLILDDPESFKNNMRSTPYPPIPLRTRDLTSLRGGIGVDLVSHNASSQISPTSTSTVHSPSAAASEKTPSEAEWPGLPAHGESLLSNSLKSLSIGRANASGKAPSTIHNQINDNDVTSLSSDSTTIGCDDDGSVTPPATPANPWSTNPVSQQLFGSSKAETVSNWDGLSAAHARSKKEDDEYNIFTSHFWDPYHPDFKPHLFYYPSTNKKHAVQPYQCPFETCKNRFATALEVGVHMRDSHAAQRNICPVCMKNFDKLSGLIAHFEASSTGAKCDVARRAGYSEVLFEITGGLIKANEATLEPIYGYKLEDDNFRPDPAQKTKTEGNGVKDFDYIASLPARPCQRRW